MKLLISIITASVIAIAIALGASLGYFSDTQPDYGTFNITGGGTYRLQTSVGSSNTSITLSSFKEPVSNIPYTMSYLQSSIMYGTLDPQNPSRKEFISFTGITQNSDGTATLTGVTRGLSFTPDITLGCTASSTLQQSHSGQSIFILSDSPCLFTKYLNTSNIATSTNILVFSSTTPPRLDSVAAQNTGTYIATTSEFATVRYVNAVAVAGASNATESVKGLVELGTALETASSTILGGTGAGLVLQSQNATDTPQRGCATGYSSTAGAGCTVIAQLTGKIRQTFLNLTENYTWSGAHVFSANLTSSALTTIAASNITTNALSLNGVLYKFPSSQTASSTTLMTDGSGTLIWDYPSVYALCVDGLRHSVSGTTATTTAVYCTIPANTLTGTASLDIYAKFDNTVNAAYGEIQFGNGSATTSLISGNQRGRLMATLFATSTTAQTSYGVFNAGADASPGTGFTHEAYPAYSTTGKLYVQFDVRPSSAGSGTADATGFYVRVNRQ